jgi:hypothetical protein
MKCELTKADRTEIYHALGLARASLLQLRIGDDGELLADCRMRLNNCDAQTVYSALINKCERIIQGAYDVYPGEVRKEGSVTFELAEHIGRILAKIGYLGENLTTEPDTCLPTPNVGVEELRALLLAR